MNTGKVSESVLKRSVLKEIKTQRVEITKSADVGTDCAFFVPGDSFDTAVSTDVSLPGIEDGVWYSIVKAAANLAASGAEPVAVFLSILLPKESQENTLKEIMRHANRACKEIKMTIAGGHTEVSECVTEPIITVTAVGRKEPRVAADISPGMDLVVTKWIALEGTAILAKNGEESLLGRYPQRMIDEAKEFQRYVSDFTEAALAVKSGSCRIHDISRGGILAALWEMVAAAGVGLDIDLKKIPIRQETIEICEHFGLNPYAMISGGSFLIVARDGEALVETLNRNNIPAQIIGKTTDSNDKIIRNEEDVRFLDRPGQDEIYKYLGGTKECN